MRKLFTLSLFVLMTAGAFAQVTLVREAPNDTFELACPRCTMAVADIALTKGQHALPMNLNKPVAVNLLCWRYYDKILGRDVLTRQEQLWTTSTQLWDEVEDEEALSLHINLDWTDSTGLQQRFFLVLAGLSKSTLARLPLESTYDLDTYAPARFAAVAQIKDAKDEMETYDCIEGTCTLKSFNAKTGAISGTFEFTANRIGMEKKGIFLNGAFLKG